MTREEELSRLQSVRLLMRLSLSENEDPVASRILAAEALTLLTKVVGSKEIELESV